MSKKQKKWWENSQTQFPNSVQQHKEKSLFGEEYDDYYDDWDRKLDTTNESNYTASKKQYNSSYDNYEKTGKWGGYGVYRTPQLSYKYVCQMANALAGQHNITLVVGNSWEVDLLNKKLKYDPGSLIYGTKSELLATLLHEIGKLRYMEHYTKLNSKYLSMYKHAAAEALFPFEDVRVDYQMLRAYESAGELYESAIPGVKKQIETYQKYAAQFKNLSIALIRDQYNYLLNNPVQDPEEQKIKLLQTFGTYDISEVHQRMNEYIRSYQENGCLFDYCADMLHAMYDLETPTTGYENIEEKVELTFPAIEPIKRVVTSQETVDIMEEQVYPVVEDLLKDLDKKSEKLKEIFKGMSDEIAEQLESSFNNSMRSVLSDGNVNPNGKSAIRMGNSSGPSQRNIPPEWASGDYKALKDSVMQEVQSLVRKLTFLRREELTVKYQSNQRRGKLDMKHLVKHAFGSRRLFKQKLESIDTIQSFAFSVLLDTSGSMEGANIIHATRAVVLFNEVFKKLQIPYELVVFNDGATTVKSFEAESNKKMEQSIGGLVAATRGGTNLDRGLEHLQIKNRTEHNKIVVVLTDGGVGSDAQKYDREFFIPWKNMNIKSIALGIDIPLECIQPLVENTGVAVENPSLLPQIFSDIIKNIIKKK